MKWHYRPNEIKQSTQWNRHYYVLYFVLADKDINIDKTKDLIVPCPSQMFRFFTILTSRVDVQMACKYYFTIKNITLFH